MNLPIKRVSLVILEDAESRVALQLRDDIPTISRPDQWGIFGGRIEENEVPFDAALREIAEELSISLNPHKLSFLRRFDTVEEYKVFYLYHYNVDRSESEAFHLSEGQLYRVIGNDQIQRGMIDGKRIIASHLDMLNWYWLQCRNLLEGMAEPGAVGNEGHPGAD